MGNSDTLVATAGVPDGVADRLPLLIHRLGSEIIVRAEPLLAAAGLSGRGYLALAVLDTDRPGSQLDLARMIGNVPAAVVAIVDELAAAGFVERTRDPDDRRRSLVTTTAAGRRALAKGDRIAAAVEDDLLGHVSPDGRARLHEALRTALLAPAAAAAG